MSPWGTLSVLHFPLSGHSHYTLCRSISDTAQQYSPTPILAKNHTAITCKQRETHTAEGYRLNMALQAALCLLLASSAAARRGPHVPRDLGEHFTVNTVAIEPSSERLSTLKVVTNVIEPERGNGSSLSSLYVNAIRAQASGDDGFYSRLEVSSRSIADRGPLADVDTQRTTKTWAKSSCSPFLVVVSFSLR
jgi:hypothetical protein